MAIDMQTAMLRVQDAVELAVLASCDREEVLAEVERAWDWWEAELRPEADERTPSDD